MMSTNPAVNKKKLSKNLREMKFMQRGTLKTELEAEEKQLVDSEHWVIDGAEIIVDKAGYVFEPSYTICCKLRYGRQSFKNFNPEIEKLNRQFEVESIEDEKAISDTEMAQSMTHLAKNISKRFKTKRNQKNRQQSSDDSDDELQYRPKLKRTFVKPNLNDL